METRDQEGQANDLPMRQAQNSPARNLQQDLQKHPFRPPSLAATDDQVITKFNDLLMAIVVAGVKGRSLTILITEISL